MLRRATLFAILAIALVLLAGCSSQTAQQPPSQPQVNQSADEGNGNVPVLDAGCMVKLGLERDLCLKEEASSKNDKGNCYLILDNSTRELCIYPFALVAPELCADLTGDMRDDCYANAAKTAMDPSYCPNIADAAKGALCADLFKGPCDDVSSEGYAKLLCAAENAKDVRKCKAAGDSADSCAFDYAIEFKDKKACATIVAEGSRNACLAILSNDATYCNSGATPESRDYCRVIAAGALKDAGICSGVTLGTAGQYKYSVQGTANYVVQCYANVGIALNNYTVCGQLQSGINRDSCYGIVARAALLPDACGYIYSQVSEAGTPIITELYDTCYRDVAKTLGDPRICNPIKATGTRDRYCYLEIIYGRNDQNGPKYNFTLEMCQGIADDNRKWTCIGELAKRTQNGSLCALIPDSSQFVAIRSTCVHDSGGSAPLNNTNG